MSYYCQKNFFSSSWPLTSENQALQYPRIIPRSPGRQTENLSWHKWTNTLCQLARALKKHVNVRYSHPEMVLSSTNATKCKKEGHEVQKCSNCSCNLPQKHLDLTLLRQEKIETQGHGLSSEGYIIWWILNTLTAYPNTSVNSSHLHVLVSLRL